MVFVTRSHRHAIYSQLYSEGVMVVKKDYYGKYSLPMAHGDPLVIPNYQVMGVMKSLKDRGIVKETFNWGWHYYFLASELKSVKTKDDTVEFTGRDQMREILGLPASVDPNTHRVDREELKTDTVQRGSRTRNNFQPSASN